METALLPYKIQTKTYKNQTSAFLTALGVIPACLLK